MHEGLPARTRGRSRDLRHQAGSSCSHPPRDTEPLRRFPTRGTSTQGDDVPMRLLRGALAEGDSALELALARAMVTQARLGRIEESLRIYRPASAVVVFGRRDTLLPGFPGAVGAAREAGFEPVVRATGGRAVAYTRAALVLDHVRHEAGSTGGQDVRFAEFGQRFVDLFRGFGVDARLGAVPGEYCPGAHSVNARGVEKLVGTAQRMVPGAWLFSSLVVVGDEDRLRPVLAEVYRCLDQDFDESLGGFSVSRGPGHRRRRGGDVDRRRLPRGRTCDPCAGRQRPARAGPELGSSASRRQGPGVTRRANGRSPSSEHRRRLALRASSEALERIGDTRYPHP